METALSIKKYPFSKHIKYIFFNKSSQEGFRGEVGCSNKFASKLIEFTFSGKTADAHGIAHTKCIHKLLTPI